MIPRKFLYINLLSILLAAFQQCLHAQDDSKLSTAESNTGEYSDLALLPTDRYFRTEVEAPLVAPITPSSPAVELPPLSVELPVETYHENEASQNTNSANEKWFPLIDASAEWEPEVDGVAIQSYDLSVKFPLYPIWGPPPPLFTTGYSLTRIESPDVYDLPQQLHEYSIGLICMRMLNQQWGIRLMLSSAMATDLDNTGSDAFQIRGGLFATYQPNEFWSYAFGVLATGRDDIPFFPAIGAIWKPSPRVIVNLMLPRPRVSLKMKDTGKYQHWGYLGGGISGGTWAFERSSGLRDKLTYREWRLVAGWELISPKQYPSMRPNNFKCNAEIGYVFGREFEFDNNAPDISIKDTLILRTGISI